MGETPIKTLQTAARAQNKSTLAHPTFRPTWHTRVFGPLLLPVTPYAIHQLHEREGQVQTQEEKQIAGGFISKN